MGVLFPKPQSPILRNEMNDNDTVCCYDDKCICNILCCYMVVKKVDRDEEFRRRNTI